jgi:hypothetical protein
MTTTIVTVPSTVSRERGIQLDIGGDYARDLIDFVADGYRADVDLVSFWIASDHRLQGASRELKRGVLEFGALEILEQILDREAQINILWAQIAACEEAQNRLMEQGD